MTTLVLVLVPVDNETTAPADDAKAILTTTTGRGLEEEGAIQE